MSIDREQMDRDRERLIFEHRLRKFIRDWGPPTTIDQDAFQRDLMLLFVDAMKSQRGAFAAGIDHYASEMVLNRSLAPLQVIMEREVKK